MAAPQKTGGKDYLVDHSSYFYLLDPRGLSGTSLIPDLSAQETSAGRLRKELGNRTG